MITVRCVIKGTTVVVSNIAVTFSSLLNFSTIVVGLDVSEESTVLVEGVRKGFSLARGSVYFLNAVFACTGNIQKQLYKKICQQ